MDFKKLLIALVVLVALAAIGVGAVYALTAEPADEPVFVNPVNSQVYAVLVEAGFEDAVVDSNEVRTLIALPIADNDDAEAVAYYAAGASATIAPGVPLVIVQIYRGSSRVLELQSKVVDALAFARGEISEGEFRQRATITKSGP